MQVGAVPGAAAKSLSPMSPDRVCPECGMALASRVKLHAHMVNVHGSSASSPPAQPRGLVRAPHSLPALSMHAKEGRVDLNTQRSSSVAERLSDAPSVELGFQGVILLGSA